MRTKMVRIAMKAWAGLAGWPGGLGGIQRDREDWEGWEERRAGGTEGGGALIRRKICST